jgi:Zn-dependent peptidase ImmA (M78 family)
VLTRGQIEEIEAQAEDLLVSTFKTADAVPLPVDVNRITQDLGLIVRQGTFPDPSVIGYYVKAERTIYIARDDPPNRKVFTIAHEIGHDVRHDLASETYHRRDSLNLASNREMEQEANWFAASLLMPRSMVRAYWPAFRDISTMAALFGVSAVAMRYRLINLGLAPDN